MAIPAGTRSEAIDAEVARYLYQSGCRNITYAPESGSIEMLKRIKKKVNLDNMLKSITYSNKEGLNVKINIILGFPDEKHKHIWDSLRFLIKASWHGVHDMSPAIFQPYPGSALFRRLAVEQKVNINDDGYFMELIGSDSFVSPYVYNENISQSVLRIYLLLTFILFL